MKHNTSLSERKLGNIKTLKIAVSVVPFLFLYQRGHRTVVMSIWKKNRGHSVPVNDERGQRTH